jgi:hypothetical protein
MGFKGQSFVDAGYVYAPYIPISTTPSVSLHHSAPDSAPRDVAQAIFAIVEEIWDQGYLVYPLHTTAIRLYYNNISDQGLIGVVAVLSDKIKCYTEYSQWLPDRTVELANPKSLDLLDDWVKLLHMRVWAANR